MDLPAVEQYLHGLQRSICDQLSAIDGAVIVLRKDAAHAPFVRTLGAVGRVIACAQRSM